MMARFRVTPSWIPEILQPAWSQTERSFICPRCKFPCFGVYRLPLGRENECSLPYVCKHCLDRPVMIPVESPKPRQPIMQHVTLEDLATAVVLEWSENH